VLSLASVVCSHAVNTRFTLRDEGKYQQQQAGQQQRRITVSKRC
jgi:hypothetical protein